MKRLCWQSWSQLMVEQVINEQRAKHVRAIERGEGAVKLAIMRSLKDNKRSRLQTCLSHWMRYHQRQVVRACEQELEINVFVVMIFCQWKYHSFGQKASQGQQQLLEERRRLHDIEVTRAKEEKIAVLELMGFKNDKTILPRHFLIWSTVWQQARQGRIHRTARNSVLSSMMRNHGKETDEQLLKTGFWALVTEARHGKSIKDHIHTKEELRAAEEERQELSCQLEHTYHQLGMLTDTLQKELRTKEELAVTLREANHQMRKASIRSLYTDSTMCTEMSSTNRNLDTELSGSWPSVNDFPFDGSPEPRTGGRGMVRSHSAGGLETMQGLRNRLGFESASPLRMHAWSKTVAEEGARHGTNQQMKRNLLRNQHGRGMMVPMSSMPLSYDADDSPQRLEC